MALSAGDVPDIAQEKLYLAIQGGNLREGVPEVVEQLDGVKLILATTAGGKTLLMVLTEMRTQGGTVLPTSGGGVASVLRATPVRANPQPVVYEWSQGIVCRVMGSKQMIEELMYPKEGASASRGGALKEQRRGMFFG